MQQQVFREICHDIMDYLDDIKHTMSSSEYIDLSRRLKNVFEYYRIDKGKIYSILDRLEHSERVYQIKCRVDDTQKKTICESINIFLTKMLIGSYMYYNLDR